MNPVSFGLALTAILLSSKSAFTCPMGCTCKDVGNDYEVHCTGQSFTVVPPGIPTKTTILRMTKTGMEGIGFGNQEQLTNLRKFYLVDNSKLAVIAPGAFGGQTKVKELHITGTPLKSVAPGVLLGLNDLQLLNLSKNKWTTLDAPAFQGLEKLVKLDLSHNEIDTVSDKAISETLKVLKSLDISSNKLTALNKKAFEGLKTLDELDITSNVFTDLPVAQLEPAINLQILDVSRNPVKKLPGNCFSKLKNLRTLKVNSMVSLDSVDDKAFAGLVNLRKFEFVDNRGVKDFTVKMFPDEIQALEEANLSNNTYRHLSREVFMNRPKLSVLTLDNLPLHCDCKLDWMGEAVQNASNWLFAQVWINATEDENTNSTSPMCASPQNLEDKPVGVMAKDDFTCERAAFHNISSVNDTNVNAYETATIEARVYPGLPSTIWLHPRGWYLRGNAYTNNTQGDNVTATQVIDHESRHVVAKLIFANVSIDDFGEYTLIASNAAGNSTQMFRLTLADDSILSTSKPVSGCCSLRSYFGIYVILLVFFYLGH